jgi:hypothetical protein
VPLSASRSRSRLLIRALQAFSAADARGPPVIAQENNLELRIARQSRDW